MSKLMLFFMVGILFLSPVMAEVYRSSTSTTFNVVLHDSTATATATVVDRGIFGNPIIYWTLGIIILLSLVYFLFKKKKVVSKKKKL